MPTKPNIRPRTRFAVVAVFASLVIFGYLPTAGAQTSADLGTAEPFAILAGSAVTNTGPSLIDGDIGIHPEAAVTGFGTATVNGDFHIANEVARIAKEDLTHAYNDAFSRPVNATIDTELGTKELLPGVYDSEDGTFEITGELTLNAQNDPDAVWIFKMESTLITATDSSVVLQNGAQACNVFWQVGSSATLGTRTDLKGNILAQTSITMNTDATLEGRALARTGAVTLDSNVITVPACVEPPADDPPIDDPPADDPTGVCVTNLMASANEDSSITLTWTSIEGAQEYRVYRAVSGGALVLHDEVSGNATHFIDRDTDVGTTYSYEVRPVDAGVESEGCDTLEVTAIPVFPSVVAGALAIGASLAGYIALRRRP